jgi:REP element-mobilizing transposase RayT
MFLSRVAGASTESQWTVLSYCLMTNHVHLLVRLGEGGLSTGMHSLLNAYVHRFNARHSCDGHLFGRRFHSSLVDEADPDHLPAVFRYIAWNPWKAGMVAAPELWQWSAHRSLLGASNPEGGLDVDAAHGYCDGPDGYRSLTSGALDDLATLLQGPRPCRRARAYGFTQAQIAEALGIDQSSVSRRIRAERTNA